MTEKSTRIPAPLYAAAGAGDLAYRQLRKLPGLADDLRGRAAGNGADLREQVTHTAAELGRRGDDLVARLRGRAAEAADRLRAVELDADRLRAVAVRNAAAFVAGAQAAQERAVALYGDLVARGERVVGTGVVRAADTVNADMEATGPVPVTSAEAQTAAQTHPAAKKAVARRAPAKAAAKKAIR